MKRQSICSLEVMKRLHITCRAMLQVVVSAEEDAVALAIDPLPQTGPIAGSSAVGSGISQLIALFLLGFSRH